MQTGLVKMEAAASADSRLRGRGTFILLEQTDATAQNVRRVSPVGNHQEWSDEVME